MPGRQQGTKPAPNSPPRCPVRRRQGSGQARAWQERQRQGDPPAAQAAAPQGGKSREAKRRDTLTGRAREQREHHATGKLDTTTSTRQPSHPAGAAPIFPLAQAFHLASFAPRPGPTPAPAPAPRRARRHRAAAPPRHAQRQGRRGRPPRRLRRLTPST